MMKKMFAMVLALVLAFAMCIPALAGAQITGSKVLSDTSEANLNRTTGTIAYRPSNSATYTLIDGQGNALTNASYIMMSDNGAGFEVALEEGLNTCGYINGQGQLMVTLAYGDIVVIDENWQIGVVLENATADNYDYKNYSGDTFYLVTAYDVYFQGTRVGSMGRLDYSSASAHGKYLYVKDRNGNFNFYDSAFNKSGYTVDSSLYNEYVYDSSRKVVWHPGSNQQAFCSTCTLTSEDVETDLFFVEGQCLDLQGNVVFTQGAYQTTSNSWKGEYYKVRGFNNCYGLIDRTGREVLPCEYDAIWEGTYDGFFGSGYQAVIKDGKFGYVNLNNEATCPFTYAESAVGSAYSPCTKLKNMEGNYIILSAAVGELPESYAYAYTYEGCPLITVEQTNGNNAVIDIYGNAVIPECSTSSINISHDGSVIVVYTDYHTYTVYTVSFTEEGTAAAVEETVVSEEAQASEEAVPETGWSCSECGTANTGKFCTECGTAKPEEEVSCKNCGYTPDGETPKFCPECGNAF